MIDRDSEKNNKSSNKITLLRLYIFGKISTNRQTESFWPEQTLNLCLRLRLNHPGSGRGLKKKKCRLRLQVEVEACRSKPVTWPRLEIWNRLTFKKKFIKFQSVRFLGERRVFQAILEFLIKKLGLWAKIKHWALIFFALFNLFTTCNLGQVRLQVQGLGQRKIANDGQVL